MALPAVAALAPLAVVSVADGIYVHVGHQENPTSANHGDIANVGFVVGSKCVAVIDTGGTAEVGQALHAAVRRVTSLPICYVINTHVHPDHIFGNAAFVGDAVQFVGHMKLSAAMGARGKNYLNAVKRDLGEVARGTEVIAPNLLVEDVMTLDLGDRALTLRAWPTAHTDNDLTVYDKKTATLWLSDLLFVDRIPVVDGSVRGWLAVIQQLRSLQPTHVIPGHGRVDPPWPQALDAEERYLALLVSEVRSAIKADRTIQQAVDTVGLSERDKWLLSDSFHRRNVTAVFAELEWED
jgi:quinoprotein relay system zinc metallohydrolase 2